jgi:hypothetical protein
MPDTSAHITALQKQISAHEQAKRKAAAAGHTAVVARESTVIKNLNARLAQAKQHAALKHTSPKQAKHVPASAPRASGADPFETTVITCENAAAVWQHYRKLLDSKAHRGFLGDAMRHHWHRRAAEARKLMRLCDKHGMATVKAMRAKKHELREGSKHQRDRAAKARSKGRMNEAMDADALATKYEDQIKVLDAAEHLPPEGVSASTSRQIERPGYPVKDGAGVDASVDASVDADGASVSASMDADLPWYRRYALPLGIAALIGVGIAVTKGGKAGKPARLTLSTLGGGKPVFRAKHRSGKPPKRPVFRASPV